MTTKRIDIVLHGKNELNKALSGASNDVKTFKRDLKNSLMDKDIDGAFNTLKKNATMVGASMMAAGAAIAAAYAIVLAQSVKIAAASEQNWNRLTAALGGNIFQVQQVKAEYSGLVDNVVKNTGRLRGDVITTIGDLTKVGITNKKVLEDSATSIAGIAALNLKDVKTVEESYTSLINKPKLRAQSINSLGLSYEKFSQVLKRNHKTEADWATMTVSQRANILNQTAAMSGAIDANALYKTSYEGMVNDLTNAYNRFMVTIGEQVLPVLKDLWTDIEPAVTGFVDWFKSLDDGQKKIVVLTPLIASLAFTIGGLAIVIWGNVAALRAWNATPMNPKTATVAGGGLGSTLVPLLAALPLLGFAMGAGGEAAKGTKNPREILAGGASGFFGGMLGDKNTALKSDKIFTQDAINSRQRLIDAWNNSADIFTNDAQDTSKGLRDGLSGLVNSFNTSGNIFTNDAKNSGKWLRSKIQGAVKGVVNFSTWAANGLNWIRNRISTNITGNLNFSNLASRTAMWIYNRISGHLNLSAVEAVAKQAASAMTRGPAGPGGSFLSRASGFTYYGYAGVGQSIGTTLASGAGNCVDGSLAQIALATSFGIPSELIQTTWRGNPHVYARIGGQNRDIANHALTGSWNPPPRGPAGGSGGNVIIYGDVYGYSDFVKKVESANNRLVRRC